MIFRRSLVRELTATAIGMFVVLLGILFTNLVLRLLARAAGGSVAPEGILALLGRKQDERVLISDLAGLGFRHPLLGLAMTVFMISLGGIPPTAGFMAKVYVFGAALDAGLLPLVIVGVLNSVVSVFYYLRITVAMYMTEEPAGGPVEVSWAAPAAIALLATLALTLWWGIQAQALLLTAQQSVRGML